MVAADTQHMVSRFLGELTLADVVTLGNAVIGFIAIVIAPSDPGLAARLILLAAVADGLDGVLARQFGGSPIGPYLDSLADAASFGVAPAVVLYVALAELEIAGLSSDVVSVLVILVPALFVTLAILRLAVYSAFDITESRTIGAPSTLSATIIVTAILTEYWSEPTLLIAGAILSLAMIVPVGYPDLLARDAVLMGGIHVLAVAQPAYYGRVFPFALLTLATLYLIFAPAFYWGESERRLRDATA